MTPDVNIKKNINSLFIGTVIFFICFDGLPSALDIHLHLKMGVNSALYRVGLSQGNWHLFAPGVDRENTKIEGKVIYEDG